MNHTMLAAVMPTTPGAAGATKAGPANGSSAVSDFAGCMEQAIDAAAAQEAAPAPTSSDAAAGNAPVTAETPAAEPVVTPAAPDLSALLPGWTAAPPQAAAMAASADLLTAAAAAIEAASASAALRAGSRGEAPSKTQAQAATNAARDAAAVHAPQAAVAVGDGASPHNAGAIANGNTPTTRSPGEARSAALDSAATSMTPSLPSLPAPALAAPSRAAEQAAESSAHLAAPIDSPAFAPTLATQVRWWAQDGVQQAQLTLNPAEMGPVAVRIVVLDGREARIDFSADFAATRTAIEAALPVLAAALDDSGLKLSGGGVHDGSAQRHSNWSHAQSVIDRTTTRGNGNAAEALAAASPGTPRAAGRGIVDLVA